MIFHATEVSGLKVGASNWVFFTLDTSDMPFTYTLRNYFVFSRDYPAEASSYAFNLSRGDSIDWAERFAKGKTPGPSNTGNPDSNKQLWFPMDNSEWWSFGKKYIAATLAYGGVVVLGDSYEELGNEWEAVAADARKTGKVNVKPIIKPLPAPIEPEPPSVTTPVIGPSSALSLNDYKAIGSGAVARSIRPADLALVLYAESGLNPAAVNTQNGSVVARGANQITLTGAAAIGIDQAEWSTINTLSLESQLGKYIFRFFDKIARSGSYDSAVTLYQTNFAPATVGRTNILYTANQDPAAYKANRWLDAKNKGYIEVADLRDVLARRVQEKAFLDHLAKLQAAGYPGEPNLAMPGGSLGTILFLAGGVGALVYWLKNRSAS